MPGIDGSIPPSFQQSYVYDVKENFVHFKYSAPAESPYEVRDASHDGIADEVTLADTDGGPTVIRFPPPLLRNLELSGELKADAPAGAGSNFQSPMVGTSISVGGKEWVVTERGVRLPDGDVKPFPVPWAGSVAAARAPQGVSFPLSSTSKATVKKESGLWGDLKVEVSSTAKPETTTSVYVTERLGQAGQGREYLREVSIHRQQPDSQPGAESFTRQVFVTGTNDPGVDVAVDPPPYPQ